jgi:hypothetical protein
LVVGDKVSWSESVVVPVMLVAGSCCYCVFWATGLPS